jgi:hypothetical protein
MSSIFGEERLMDMNERTIKLLNIDVETQSSTVRDFPFDLAKPEGIKLMTVRNIMMWTRFNMIIDRQPTLERDILRLEDSMKEEKKDNDDLRKNRLAKEKIDLAAELDGIKRHFYGKVKLFANDDLNKPTTE